MAFWLTLPKKAVFRTRDPPPHWARCSHPCCGSEGVYAPGVPPAGIRPARGAPGRPVVGVLCHHQEGTRCGVGVGGCRRWCWSVWCCLLHTYLLFHFRVYNKVYVLKYSLVLLSKLKYIFFFAKLFGSVNLNIYFCSRKQN